jgi:hypothetical protein
LYNHILLLFRCVKPIKKIRADFNRDSSLDESKIQHAKKKRKQIKRKATTPPESSYDELYESYLREKKKKQILKKKRAVSVQNVQISTPVQEKLRKKSKKTDLQFELSPIRLNDSCGIENTDTTKQLYDSFKRQRLKEIEDNEKALESSAVRAAKALLAKYKNKKPLVSSEITRKRFSTELETLESPLFIHKRRRETKLSTGRELIMSAEDDDVKENNVKLSLTLSHTSIPSIHVTAAEQERSSNSMESPTKFFDEQQIVPSPARESADVPSLADPPSKALPLMDESIVMELPNIQSRKSKRNAKISLKVSNCDKSNNSRLSEAETVQIEAANAPKKSEINHVQTVDSNETNRVKKSVGFAVPENLDLTERLSLKPGKWRRSLIAWRSSNNGTCRQTNTIMEESSIQEQCESKKFFFIYIEDKNF